MLPVILLHDVEYRQKLYYNIDKCSEIMSMDVSIPVTTEQLSSGEVAFLLNNSIQGGAVWKQNLDNEEGSDTYPNPS